MTARSTHLVLVPGLACTEDLFAEQIASLRGGFWCKRQKDGIFGVNTPLEGANPNAEH